MSSWTASAAAGFFVLHGLVHLWFVTLSQKWVEFQADMGWTGESWLLGGLFDQPALRALATGGYALAALVFVGAGIGTAAGADWARPALAAAAVFSTAVVLGFWDGGFEMLVQKGLLAIIINIGVLGALVLTD